MEDLGLDDIFDSIDTTGNDGMGPLETIPETKPEKSLEDQMVEKYIVDREVSTENLTIDFAKQMLAYDLEIKEIKEAQGEIKKEAKSEGIAIKQVNAALAKLKKMAKANPLDEEEENFLVEQFQENVDIGVLIHQLTAKND